jgi:hypothetical protein
MIGPSPHCYSHIHEWFFGTRFDAIQRFVLTSIITIAIVTIMLLLSLSSPSSSLLLPAYAQMSTYPIKIEGVTLMDPSGHALDDCHQSEGLVMIAVTLRNLSSSVQPATVVVELANENSGITQFLQWQTMSINSNALQQIAISFNPSSLSSLSSSTTFQYDAKVIVWNSILTPMPLGDPLSVSLSC